MESALVEAAGPIADAFATLEHFVDLGVQFEPLELFVRIQIWVLVVEADDEPKVHQVRRHVIKEAPSVDVTWHRPANCMLNRARFEVWIILSDLPNFFKSNTIVLRADTVFLQIKLGLQTFRK